MEKTVFILLSALLLSCNYETSNRSEAVISLNDSMLECLVSSFNNDGINYTSEINNYEDYLVSNGLLESSNGIAYYSYFEKITASNAFPNFGYQPIYKQSKFWKLVDSVVCFCMSKEPNNKSKALAAVKYNQFMNSVNELGSFSSTYPAILGYSIYSKFDSTDFAQPLVRVAALNTIISYGNIINLTTCQDSTSTSQFKSQCDNQLDIKLDQHAQIYLGKNVVKSENVSAVLKDSIALKKLEIELRIHPHSSYDTYVILMDAILTAFRDTHEERAQKIYGRSFRELRGSEKARISNDYPIKVKLI